VLVCALGFWGDPRVFELGTGLCTHMTVLHVVVGVFRLWVGVSALLGGGKKNLNNSVTTTSSCRWIGKSCKNILRMVVLCCSVDVPAFAY